MITGILRKISFMQRLVIFFNKYLIAYCVSAVVLGTVVTMDNIKIILIKQVLTGVGVKR